MYEYGILLIIFIIVAMKIAYDSYSNLKEKTYINPNKIEITFDKTKVSSAFSNAEIYPLIKLVDSNGSLYPYSVDDIQMSDLQTAESKITLSVHKATNQDKLDIPYRLEILNIDNRFSGTVITIYPFDNNNMIDKIIYKPQLETANKFIIPLTTTLTKF